MASNEGSEHPVIAILRAAQSNEAFQEALNYDAGKTRQFLKEHGIEADNNDVLLALQVRGFIDEFKDTWSKPVNHPEPEDEDEHKLRLKLRQGLIEGLLAVIKEIDKGYAKVMRMYIVTFYVGITFLLVAVLASLTLHENASTYLFGGLGFLGVVGTLIFRPTESLQRSRSKLAQLQALFIGWLNDSYNWNRYWETMINSVLEHTKQPPEFKKVYEVSKVQLEHTREMMELIQQYSQPNPRTPLTQSVRTSRESSQTTNSTGNTTPTSLEVSADNRTQPDANQTPTSAETTATDK